MSAHEIPEHSENSPSSSEGWMTCADYINANRGLPDVQSWEAAEGTAAHWIRNECLMQGLDADGFIGHVQQIGPWSFEWTDDDARLLQPSIDWIRSHVGRIYGEHRVEITEWAGRDSHGRPQFGTMDVGFVGEDIFFIDDLKWGRGVPVYARSAKSIRIYALAFWHSMGRPNVEKILLSISQPRHAGGGGQHWITLDELLEFGEMVKAAAAANRAPNPSRTASLGGCMWCRRKVARGGCPTFDRYFLDVLGIDPADLDQGTLTMDTVLTPERIAVLIEHQPMIEKYLEQVRERALEDALAGTPPPGMKAVEGRKDADRWHDEKGEATAAVVPFLADQSFTRKLKTPTQVATALGKDSIAFAFLESCIRRGRRKPILVPVEDERPELITVADLEDLDEQ